MRNIFLFLVLFLAFGINAHAQKLSQSQTLQTSETVQVNGATKDELFARAQSWLLQTYSPDNAPIQRADRDAGVLVGNGTFAYKGSQTISGEVWHTITISVRDGQYRYSFANFYFIPAQGEAQSFEGKFMKDNTTIRNNTEETLNKLISGLKAAMAAKKTLPRGYREQLHWPGS